MQKRIFIAYTGGTIGMRRTPQGYVPESGLDRLLAHMIPPDLAEDMPDYVLHECSHLIDSANLHPVTGIGSPTLSPATTMTTMGSSYCTAPTPWPTLHRGSPSPCRA